MSTNEKNDWCDPSRDLFNLSVNDGKNRPFHCDKCGDTFEPCKHWGEATVDWKVNRKSVHGEL